MTDFLGGGEMGYWLAPGLRNTPDPDEYVRLAPGSSWRKDGRFELRVTNELEETVFLDHGTCWRWTIPEGVEVHPAEGMTRRAPGLPALRRPRPAHAPRAADDRGRDWTERVARADRRFADGFALRPIRGYAEPHGLILDLSEVPSRATPCCS